MDDPVRVDVICEDEMTAIRTFICKSGDVESLRSDLRAIGAAPMYMCVTSLDKPADDYADEYRRYRPRSGHRDIHS